MDRGTGKAAGPVRERELSAFDINLHTGNGIDQGDAVRPSFFRRLRHLRDAGHVRRQLHDDRLRGNVFNLARNIAQNIRVCAEGNCPLFDIRTGDIDFQKINAFLVPQSFHNAQVFFDRVSADVGDHTGIVRGKKFQIPLDKNINARILQPDCVQHASVHLRDAGRLIPLPRHGRYTFALDSSKAVKVYKFPVFHSGAEGSGRRHHGIFKMNAGNIHRKIRLCLHA